MSEKKEIPGFPGYFADRLGDVTGLNATPRLDAYGRLSYFLRNAEGTEVQVEAGKAVLLAWFGEAPDGYPFVVHINGHLTQNALSNLDYSATDEVAELVAQRDEQRRAADERAKANREAAEKAQALLNQQRDYQRSQMKARKGSK